MGLLCLAVSGNWYRGRKLPPMWWAFCCLTHGISQLILIVMSKSHNISPEENEVLRAFIAQTYSAEMAQAEDLISNCNNPYQFAKTHSTYVKDWEKTKSNMENGLKPEVVLPPHMTKNLLEAMILESENIIQMKLTNIRNAFQIKFRESIYKYIGPDGKTKKLFGIFG